MGNNSVQKIENSTNHKIRKTFSSIEKYNPSTSQNNPSISYNHDRKSNSVPKKKDQKVDNFLSKNNEQNLSTDAQDKNLIKKEVLNTKDQDLNLKNQKICLFQQQKQNQNTKQNPKSSILFIFDWDDTLFFTNHLRHSKSSIIKQTQKQILQKFDNSVCILLKACLKFGKLIIISNSQQGWVKYSSQLFLPKTYQIIFIKQKIRVISSRPKSEEKIQLEMLGKWKFTAFKTFLQQFILNNQSSQLKKQNLHLICIGDSQQQISAGKLTFQQFHSYFKNLYIKTIKLQQYPNIDDLMEQQQLFLNKLQTIVNANKKLIIRLERPRKQSFDNVIWHE